MRTPGLAPVIALAAALALALACDDDAPNQPPDPEGVVPDFSLLDVNPKSTTFDQKISPRQLEGKISAWYFGHAN